MHQSATEGAGGLSRRSRPSEQSSSLVASDLERLVVLKEFTINVGITVEQFVTLFASCCSISFCHVSESNKIRITTLVI